MSEQPPIIDATLETLGQIPTQTLVDALWVKGWSTTYIIEFLGHEDFVKLSS